MTGPNQCLCGYNGTDWQAVRLPTFGPRRLFGCPSCGLFRLHPFPIEEEDVALLYQNERYLEKITHAEYFGYYKVFEEHLRLRMGMSKDASILDFGAGRCHYQAFFLKDGYRDVHSVEINPHLVRFAREELALDHVYLSAERLREARYDVVVSSQVFEHLIDPLRTLENDILPALVSGGLVCFAVPNWDALSRHVLRGRWPGYSAEDHIWFFSPRSVARIFFGRRAFDLLDVRVIASVGKPYDGFRPTGVCKRLYYRTASRLFERIGRGDQLVVTLRKTDLTSAISRAGR